MTIRVTEAQNRTLATAAEVAERKAMQSEPPTAPKPRHVVVDARGYGRLHPSATEIELRATGTGGVEQAVESLRNEYKPKHEALRGVAPDLFEDVAAQMEAGAAILDTARDTLLASFERLDALKTELEQRGNLRHRARQLRQESDGLTAKLSDPSSCSLPPEQQFAMSQRLKFIPAELDTVEKSIAASTARIEKLRPGFDLAAIIRRMDAETRMPNGGFYSDRSHIHQGVERGDIAPD